jgi:hypothetical protein
MIADLTLSQLVSEARRAYRHLAVLERSQWIPRMSEDPKLMRGMGFLVLVASVLMMLVDMSV